MHDAYRGAADMAVENRFDAIAALVPGKTRLQCMARCKHVKAALMRRAQVPKRALHNPERAL
jgi:hypothetical protein